MDQAPQQSFPESSMPPYQPGLDAGPASHPYSELPYAREYDFHPELLPESEREKQRNVSEFLYGIRTRS